MTQELPDIVFNLELLKLRSNAKKNCTCRGATFEIDSVNRLVYCQKCGAVIEPFQALQRIAMNYTGLKEDTEHLLAQRREIANYKPWRVAIKRIEKNSQGGKMIPTCPKCNEPFRLEELTFWVNPAYYTPKESEQ